MSSFLNRGCFKKRAFATKAEALAVPGRHKNVYLCPLGQHYHRRSKISHRQATGR